jgi:two-component system phosphate regulon sensor histidine kinase PhoR
MSEMNGPSDDLARLKRENEELKAQLQGNKPEPAAPPEPSAEMASISEGDATLRRLVQRMAMILQAEKIAIMFYQQETGELVAIPPAVGIEEAQLEHFKLRATQGISGEVFRDGRPIIFHGANVDVRTRKDIVSMFNITNGITVPLVIERRDEENRVVDRTTIGVLHAMNKRHGDDFNDEDVRLLERMAKNVGAIIANLQLYRKVVAEREELLQTFESLTTGLVLVSPSGRLSQANATARTMFRLGIEAVGKDYKEVISNADLVKFLDEGLTGSEPASIEITLEFPGTERIYQVNGAVVKNEEMRMLGFVVILNDVTEAKNIDKMKNSFVAMASHELRTPLTAIKGFSQTLLEGVEDDIYSKEDQKEFLGIVVNECDRLRRLIDDLLNTARIEAGESLKPDYAEFDLVPVADRAVKVQQQASVKHDVKLEIHSTDLPQRIVGDQDKLDQILTNLLNNAIKYSPEGGQVTVHLWREGDKLKFGVQDQGIGIPADQLTKVFDKFHRVNNDDNRKIYGTGLGLYLVRHLVERVHLGRIWVESELGKGSTFFFEIPVKLDLEEAHRLND